MTTSFPSIVQGGAEVTRVLRPIDGSHFRKVLSHFCSGITVITAAGPDEKYGMTCQSFFSVSLDPPLVAFSVSKTSSSYSKIRNLGSCAINVLSESQRGLSDGFARSGTDKWAGVEWTCGVQTGHPLLTGSAAWLECDIESEQEAGDHWLVLARVLDLQFHESRGPLVFFKGKYRSLWSRLPGDAPRIFWDWDNF